MMVVRICRSGPSVLPVPQDLIAVAEFLVEQGVALTGRNTTGPPCSVTVEL